MAAPELTDKVEQQYLPRIARAFAECGYEGVTLRQIARACDIDVVTLKQYWPDKAAMFVAALEYAYDAAEKTWSLLLRPDPPIEAAERLLHFAAEMGSEFTVAKMFSTGMDAADEPTIRATLRRMNRRLARFLAGEITQRHIDSLEGVSGDEALRTQAGVVLRELARVQQRADEQTSQRRASMIRELTAAVTSAKQANANQRAG
jgi:AcrR family transcriptional regulator